ncbi:hypothetical protein Va1_316 [Vibrio phage Va1]|nr:hypothetical protein Va1_316 [Vibrio phage Va1]
MTSQANQIAKLSENLTWEQFSKLYPNCKQPKEWFEAMDEVFQKTSIKTIKRQAAFIAQCGHESGGWRVFSENLNYSSKALNIVFAKYFKRAGRDASAYHRQPERIANVVYANRMGNGNTVSGDGWKYRGRGPIQLTGKNNYQAFEKSSLFRSNFGDLSIVDNPDLVSTNKSIALLSAIWYWETNNLNKYSDSFNIKTLTKRINGGYNGLEDRIHHYSKIMCEIVGIQKIGANNPNVAILQEMMGLYPDGIFGKNTHSSILKIQRSNRLTQDGIVGPKTTNAICLQKIK